MDIVSAYKIPFLIISVFILFDIITGFTGAVLEKRVSSAKMRDGIEHKIAFYLIWLFAFVVEICSSVADLGFTIPTVWPVTVYVVATETVSILENISSMNPALRNSKISEIFKNKNVYTGDDEV